MFVNISTDQIVISIQGEILSFHRDEVEKTIGPTLVQLARKYNFSDIVVLNGPGGFTNLRVGALCINMLNTLFDKKFNIYSVDKIMLYQYFVQQLILPPRGIIYIGQKKNIWDYDFIKRTYTQSKKDTILNNDFENKTDGNYFLDLVYENGYFGDIYNETNTLAIYGNGQQISISYQGKNSSANMEDLAIKGEKYIQANYFIQPILGKQGQ